MTMTLTDVVGFINAGVPFTFEPNSIEDYQPIKARTSTVTATINLGAISQEVADLFYGDKALGCIEEARTVYEHVKGYSDLSRSKRAPEGWTFLGSGGTRACYLSPSGVAYKVCHRYQEEEQHPNNNDVEHDNFAFIKRSGKLLPGWRIPRTHLYKFKGKYAKWSYSDNADVEVDAYITIMAIECIDGETFTELWRARKDKSDTSLDDLINKAFTAVGLDDAYMGNAMRCKAGINWIVDAAEAYLDETKDRKYVR